MNIFISTDDCHYIGLYKKERSILGRKSIFALWYAWDVDAKLLRFDQIREPLLNKIPGILNHQWGGEIKQDFYL